MSANLVFIPAVLLNVPKGIVLIHCLRSMMSSSILFLGHLLEPSSDLNGRFSVLFFNVARQTELHLLS